jgi:small subunit ribosomal protein S4
VKRIYGLLERQFHFYYRRAAKAKGVTGSVLLQSLERRLDNIIFRCGFATSRAHARQRVLHGFIMVNEVRVNIPSYPVKEQDQIAIKAKEETLKRIREAFELVKDRGIPPWLSVDPVNLTAQVIRLPAREEIPLPVQEQLIIELYSK